MPSTIAFFPWLTVTQPVTVGAVRLLPYARGTQPGNTEWAQQADLDALIAAYSYRKDSVVQRATLIEVGEWHNGQDASPEIHTALFRARELLAFAAIANREIFPARHYTNYHTYALTLQRYEAANAGAFAFNVRRRDYGSTHVWDAEEFAFLKPLHVEAGARLEFDRVLFEALLNADSINRAPYEAIVEFNLANTDALDIPPHIEAVLMRSAYEFLFESDLNAVEFVRQLLPLVPEFAPSEDFPCPEFARWAERWPRAPRPLAAWAQEFSLLRNKSGHGGRRGAAPMNWSIDAHLAFSSILFPRLVRAMLMRDGFLALSERQQIQFGWTEALLGYNPYAPRPPPPAALPPHEWQRIQSDGVMGEVFAKHMREALRDLPD